MHNPNTSHYTFPSDESSVPLDPLRAALTQGVPLGTDFRVWSSNMDGWGDPVGNQQSGGQDVQSLDSQTTYDFVASVTKIWGQHTFKTGVDARRMYDNHWELLYDDAMYQGWATDQTDDNRDGNTLWSTPGGLCEYVGRLAARHSERRRSEFAAGSDQRAELLCRLHPGRLEGQQEVDPQPGRALGHGDAHNRSLQQQLRLEPERSQRLDHPVQL